MTNLLIKMFHLTSNQNNTKSNNDVLIKMAKNFEIVIARLAKK